MPHLTRMCYRTVLPKTWVLVELVTMKKSWVYFVSLLALAILPNGLPVWAQAPKPAPAAPAAAAKDGVLIGYIDRARIDNDTRRAWEIAELLRKELGTREQEVRELETRVKNLQAQLPSIAQPRERELKEREVQQQGQRLQQVGRAFVDDLDRRKAEERRKYYVEVGAIVNKIAEVRKFDLVLQEAVFAGKAVDITDEVVKQLGGPSPASPVAPAPKPATR